MAISSVRDDRIWRKARRWKCAFLCGYGVSLVIPDWSIGLPDFFIVRSSTSEPTEQSNTLPDHHFHKMSTDKLLCAWMKLVKQINYKSYIIRYNAIIINSRYSSGWRVQSESENTLWIFCTISVIDRYFYSSRAMFLTQRRGVLWDQCKKKYNILLLLRTDRRPHIWENFKWPYLSPVSRRISRRPPAEKNFRLSRRWFC